MLLNLIFLFIGLVLGLVLGVAIYWLPLGQFSNEWRSLFSLNLKKYRRGDQVLVRAGVELRLVKDPSCSKLLTNDVTLSVFYDRGVEWYHTQDRGWVRARVLYMSSKNNDAEIYKVSHLDLK